jgi:serine/threonine-protein kinase
VHRDLKPANVFLTRAPVGLEVVKILDFGISKFLDEAARSTVTGVGHFVGTPRYTSPEQLLCPGLVGARSDLYAVAVLLYEMLSGESPYVASSVAERIDKLRTEAPRPLGMVAPYLPDGICAIVGRGLARDPNARWPEATTFATALRDFLNGSGPMSSRAVEVVTLSRAPTLCAPEDGGGYGERGPPTKVQDTLRGRGAA